MEPDELIEKYANGERHFRYANLYGADLSGAYFYGANLYGANLYGADLSGAYFYGANLYAADLYGADLSRTNLRYANLSGADLSRTNLRYANLSGADLYGADLSRADFRSANLTGANLGEANLRDADLTGAHLAWVRGNGKQICSTHMGKYDLVWTAEKLWIGCQSATFEEWWARTPEDIDRIESGAGELWKEHRDFIRSMIERFPATPTNSKAPTKSGSRVEMS